MERTPAKQLASNITLVTKDGFRVGNAIIIEPVESTLAGITYWYWLVETDFGNRLRCTDAEIHSLWELGFEQDYTVWAADRDALRANSTIDDEGTAA